MPFVPVEHDPFSAAAPVPSGAPAGQLVPVDHDPFAPAQASNMGFGDRAQREADPTRQQMQGAYEEMARGARERQGPVAATVDTIGRGLARAVPFMNDIAAAGDYYINGQGSSFQDAKDRVEAMNRVDDTQRPVASYGSQIAGGVALPGGALASSGVKGAAKVGGVYGALYGAGEGDTVGQRATNAAGGAVTGAALGGAASAALTGLGAAAGAVGGKVSDLAGVVRGAINPEAEAARRVGRAFQRDAATGQVVDQAAMTAAREAGQPVIAADAGGETVRALARSASNTSPEGRAALQGAVMDRSEAQAPRVTDFLRSVTGASGDPEAVREALKAEARRVNRPAYAKAYQAGSGGIWDEELGALAGAPAVQDAIRKATTTGRNRAVADGFPQTESPFTKGPGGSVQLRSNPDGSTATPTLQFWDHVKRNLDDKFTSLQRAGNNSEAADVGALRDQLVGKLDLAVPTFADARAGAAKFFGAQDASEAGQKFVAGGLNNNEARRAIGKMSEPERKLFADGFSSEIINRVNNISDRRDIVNAIFGTPNARERVEVALGRGKAAELEAFLRVENIMNITKRAVTGNSSTMRQLAEAGLAGGAYSGAGGAAGFMSTGDYSGAGIGAAMGAAARLGKFRVDGRVAQKVGEMLASTDPAVRDKAMQQIVRNPHESPILTPPRAGFSLFGAPHGNPLALVASGAGRP
jgi:hypothetical protein